LSFVGIIPNPASGKDIRRVAAHAFVVGNREKANIVGRMLIGLHAAGVRDVRIMPDGFGIGYCAMHELHRRWPEVVSGVSILDMDFVGAWDDSVLAATLLRKQGAGCIITLGGDGTVRDVAKACADTPILPVSTGTNNVMPRFIEGTIAGLAAGFMTLQGKGALEELCLRAKRIDIIVNGQVVDLALVDVAVVAGSFAGARAVWQVDMLRQVAVTSASPVSLGLSSIVGLLHPIAGHDAFGAMVSVGPEGHAQTVRAPVGPGLIASVPIRELSIMVPGRPYPVVPERPLQLALDGERKIGLRSGDEASLMLRTDGPWIVDVDRVMRRAAHNKHFVS
jgi:predicted polyphosphate/ATP-dependent NAD kinase